MQKNAEKYVFGYTDAHIKMLQQRDFAKHCQFFLPYLKPGMRVLDCGCGPGNLTLGFAKAVAPAEVIAIDISTEQLEIAKDNAQRAGVSNITFQQADVTALPFADNSFDFVYAQTLLCHLKEPLLAINEQKRVTRSGGLIAARDIYKHEELLIYPTNKVLNEALKLFYQAILDTVGSCDIGIKLGEYFTVAGLREISHSLVCENFPAKFAAEFYGTIIAQIPYTKKLLQAGRLTQQQLESYQQAWINFGNTPGAYYGIIWADAIGRK